MRKWHILGQPALSPNTVRVWRRIHLRMLLLFGPIPRTIPVGKKVLGDPEPGTEA